MATSAGVHPVSGGSSATDASGKISNKLAAPLDATQFEMGVTLGTGSFGRVRFATHKVLVMYFAKRNDPSDMLFSQLARIGL